MQVMVALWMAGLFLAAIILGLLLYLFCNQRFEVLASQTIV